jgi:quercetin dioxygenase-like cupin family protein
MEVEMSYRSVDGGEIVIQQDYVKRIIFKPDDFPNPGHLLQVVTIPPNTKQRLHWHRKQTEVFFALEGECLIYLNGLEYRTRPGDAILCNPNDKHNLWNKTKKPFKLAVFKINLPDKDDTVWVENDGE